jgi:hypothetical protein
MLLEFESTKAKESFVDLCTNNATLLAKINPKAHIRPCTFTMIFCFIPCDRQFDPSNTNHLRNLEHENDLPPGTVISAAWCKHPEKRSPNQSTATLKVQCTSPDSANRLITSHICVEDHLVNVHKDIWLPI